MSNPFDKLPAEIFMKIIRNVAADDDDNGGDKIKLTPYATVDRTWQVMIESIVFRFEDHPLTVDLPDLDDFARIFSVERRRGHLQRLRLELIIMPRFHKMGRSLLSVLDEGSDELHSDIRDYVSEAFTTLLNVLGSWEKGTARLDVEYTVGLVAGDMLEAASPMWLPKPGLRIDLSNACIVDVVRCFSRSKDRTSMGLSPGSLVALFKRMHGLQCAGVDVRLGSGDNGALKNSQRFIASLGCFTHFLTDLRLNLDQQLAPSFADCERGFSTAIRSLFDMAEQLHHLQLTNVVNPGLFLVESLMRSSRKEKAAWPQLLSFEVSGFYAREMEGSVVRENAKVRFVQEMCPRITKYKFGMRIWHKILPPSVAAKRGVSSFSMKYRW